MARFGAVLAFNGMILNGTARLLALNGAAPSVSVCLWWRASHSIHANRASANVTTQKVA
jgi:hypothetical protein